MSLPINIDDLVNSDTVESVRLEFKEGWNPEEILRTVCAFSNDIKENGGGYVIIGIKEKDGMPELPPIGIDPRTIDKIQKEFSEKIVFSIKPNIFPTIEPIKYQDKWIVIIWVTTGEERPYTAPSTLGTKGQRREYVRDGSITRPATEKEINTLRELSQFKHFDDRVNVQASLNELDLNLIQSYLQKIKSQLFDETSKLSFEALCLKMQIARGPKENIKPLNIGLLLFSTNPEKYFPGCKTNLVEFTDDGGSLIEHSFVGPIYTQAIQILEYLKANILKQQVQKNESGIETLRFWNYPYSALKEIIVNSLYHRDYSDPTPNEIRIYHSGPNRRIEILSYPGPLPPIDQEALLQEEITARNYRNIRLGDWLKSLRLAEKYATGIPTIRNAMNKNGSPPPEFRMDDDRSFFAVTLKINQDWITDSNIQSNETNSILLTNEELLVLELCQHQSQVYEDISRALLKDISKRLLPNILSSLKTQGYITENVIRKFFGVIKIRIFSITSKGKEALKKSF